MRVSLEVHEKIIELSGDLLILQKKYDHGTYLFCFNLPRLMIMQIIIHSPFTFVHFFRLFHHFSMVKSYKSMKQHLCFMAPGAAIVHGSSRRGTDFFRDLRRSWWPGPTGRYHWWLINEPINIGYVSPPMNQSLTNHGTWTHHSYVIIH